MAFFIPQARKLEQTDPQVTPLSIFSQREAIIPDLFKLLGKRRYECMYDPFSGSGSISFAAMNIELAQRYLLNDSFPSYKYLWELVKSDPKELITNYTRYVEEYCVQPKGKRANFYNQLLNDFNEANKANLLIKAAMLFAFLINFAEKNIPLFDSALDLSTQANVFIDIEIEKRKLTKFSQRVMRLSSLLNKYKTSFSSGNFLPALETASKGDLVILDPPYPAQAKNIYFKTQEEKVVQEQLKLTFEQLNSKNVDFIAMYGAGAVALKDQFNEEKLGIQHLVRFSTHHIFGQLLEHIYVSRSIPLTAEQLPKGIAFYHAFFTPGREISPESYDRAFITLKLQQQDEKASQQVQQTPQL